MTSTKCSNKFTNLKISKDGVEVPNNAMCTKRVSEPIYKTQPQTKHTSNERADRNENQCENMNFNGLSDNN